MADGKGAMIMGSMSGWHVLIVAVFIFGVSALALLILKSKKTSSTYRILIAIGGVIVLLFIIRTADSLLAETQKIPQRSFSEARENMNNYTDDQREFFNDYFSIFYAQGYILEICVDQIGYGAKSGLENFKREFAAIIDTAKNKGVLNDDMILDANALVKGAIELKGGRIAESDCSGSISYLSSFGMLND